MQKQAAAPMPLPHNKIRDIAEKFINDMIQVIRHNGTIYEFKSNPLRYFTRYHDKFNFTTGSLLETNIAGYPFELLVDFKINAISASFANTSEEFTIEERKQYNINKYPKIPAKLISILFGEDYLQTFASKLKNYRLKNYSIQFKTEEQFLNYTASYFKRDLRIILIHEFTHAFDIIGDGINKYYKDINELNINDTQQKQHAGFYFSTREEIKAYINEITAEIYYITNRMDSQEFLSLCRTQSLNKVLSNLSPMYTKVMEQLEIYPEDYNTTMIGSLAKRKRKAKIKINHALLTVIKTIIKDKESKKEQDINKLASNPLPIPEDLIKLITESMIVDLKKFIKESATPTEFIFYYRDYLALNPTQLYGPFYLTSIDKKQFYLYVVLEFTYDIYNSMAYQNIDPNLIKNIPTYTRKNHKIYKDYKNKLISLNINKENIKELADLFKILDKNNKINGENTVLRLIESYFRKYIRDVLYHEFTHVMDYSISTPEIFEKINKHYRGIFQPEADIDSLEFYFTTREEVKAFINQLISEINYFYENITLNETFKIIEDNGYSYFFNNFLKSYPIIMSYLAENPEQSKVHRVNKPLETRKREARHKINQTLIKYIQKLKEKHFKEQDIKEQDINKLSSWLEANNFIEEISLLNSLQKPANY